MISLLLAWLRLRHLAAGCPRFWEDMPADKPGKWVAVSIRLSSFVSPVEVETKTVEGLRNAYIEARRLALKLHDELPYADGELGVKWAVRPSRE